MRRGEVCNGRSARSLLSLINLEHRWAARLRGAYGTEAPATAVQSADGQANSLVALEPPRFPRETTQYPSRSLTKEAVVPWREYHQLFARERCAALGQLQGDLIDVIRTAPLSCTRSDLRSAAGRKHTQRPPFAPYRRGVGELSNGQAKPKYIGRKHAQSRGQTHLFVPSPLLLLPLSPLSCLSRLAGGRRASSCCEPCDPWLAQRKATRSAVLQLICTSEKFGFDWT